MIVTFALTAKISFAIKLDLSKELLSLYDFVEIFTYMKTARDKNLCDFYIEITRKCFLECS